MLMRKHITLFISLFFFCFTVSAREFEVTGKNILLYNMNDDSIIYEEKKDEKTSIASLTKIMTSIIAIENINNLNDTVMITTFDFAGTNGYSKAGFKLGEKVTYEDLLYGVLLPSGADAVNALVNNTLGTKEFIKQMNELAKKLGMNNTSFSNAIGKDDELNYSTANDLAILLKYALKNPEFKKIFTTKEYVTTNGLKLESTINSYKNILNIDLIKGAKSGFTKDAGRCLASITSINDVDYLLIVIKSSQDNPFNAVKDTITIYDYYSKNYSYQEIINESTPIKEIPVKWSKEKSYLITGNEIINLYLKNDTSKNLEYVYDGIEKIDINTKKGTKLGTIKVINEDNILYESVVFLDRKINYYHPVYWLVGIIILIICISSIILKKRKKRKFVRNKKIML